MDVVNELYDTFIGDYIYAFAYPKRTALYDYPQATNASAQPFSSWQYEPSTSFFSITPSKAAYMSEWSRDNIYRQAINLFLITWIFGFVLYFVFATLSYIFIFDKETMKHPKYLKNQVRKEIRQTMESMPGMSLLTLPFFLAEVRGYSKMYDTTAEGPGMWYNYFQFPLFLIFTDFCIYWVHRGLHHPRVYKTLHKPHHKWIMPTPYASHAFHPVDGFAQSLPYHIFPFIFPLQKLAYVFLFVFINFWTILIHDGEYVANSPVINGAACHTMHHLYFNYNYGQYTTLWDRLGNSYRKPNLELFHKDKKKSDTEWKKQVQEMEKMVREVEGEDDRTYVVPGEEKKTN
ncbi:uncharacterized protein BCR38DRAFT_345256 [Pseudomassariella vexata]|uniref:Fatty acid hydroxylase domain-containing protein n=1 Tax=Pseudomassariella vexata TaxID=1141098 RepID=A0A1Y2DWC6_9PEZI|nr:uncharacterized protein BCR38DRAFT_345256 [Pseudomassariella vexata]ORY63578.1 hypothetical protein BCR38DRAFT_345256 [Pseudomassariella vexata]